MKTLYPALSVYLPANLLLSELKDINKRWIEKYLWLIHTIVFKQITRRDNFNNYVNLKSELLKKYLGDKYYKKIIITLLENKVIEVMKNKKGEDAYNNNPIKGKVYSKSYRLTKKYQEAPKVSVEITKQSYCRKIALFNKEYLEELLKDAIIQKEFRELTGVRIKTNEALNFIASNKDYSPEQKEAIKLQVYEVAKLKNVRTEGGTVQNAIFTFKRDRAGRLHTPLTNLAKDIRNRFVYFLDDEDGEPIEVDMPNSQQIFFCSKYLNKLQEKEGKKMHHIGSSPLSFNPYLSTPTEGGQKANLSRLAALAGQEDNLPYVVHFSNDIEAFKYFCFNGKIYDVLMELTNTKLTRKQFKTYYFKNLWYNSVGTKKNPKTKFSKLERVFAEYFPNVFHILYSKKLSIGNREFCNGLQREESTFFHRLIVPNIGVNTPFFIIHDAIFSTSKHALELNRLFEDACQQTFGCAVNFKIALL